MTNSRHFTQFTLSVALAAALAASAMGGAIAEQSATVPTDPGFKPDTGQINPGVEEQAPTQSSEIVSIPTPEESRAALMMPISKQPSAGTMPTDPRPDLPSATAPKQTQIEDAPKAQRESQNAAGGPEGLTTAGSTPVSNGPTGAPSASVTTGKGSSASSEPPPSGPIGSVGETIPAKFSRRNDILDRTPIMAWPLPLSDGQRKQIYDAVMAEKSQPVAGADALIPASELSPNQALNGMRPLPESVRGIDGVSRLYYIKAKDKVLLIEPNVRTVVGQITAF
ncbi:MAG TPA: hypothetical protein VFX32_09815 [Pseudolabrys sp.]|jgi:hypothetical protein|nr:hypothetical protein [Pseudolabrys sp.]